FVMTLHALLRHPGSGEIVLDHPDPAIVGVTGVVVAALVQIGEIDLLVFVLSGVQGGAGKRAVESGTARIVTIPLQLQIDQGLNRAVAQVMNFVTDSDGVAAVFQNERLHDADIVRGGFEADGGTPAFLLFANEAEGSQVRRVVLPRRSAHDARLGDIVVSGTAVQQYKARVILVRDCVVGQYRAHQLCALSVKGQAKNVRADFHLLRLGWGRKLFTRNRRCRGRRGGAGNSGVGHADFALLSLSGGADRFGSEART